MPNALAVLVLAATLSSSKLLTGPTVQLQLRDGDAITMPAPRAQKGPRPRIVEFREAPGIARGTTFERFRKDAAAASRLATHGGARIWIPAPKHEFHRTFRGVAVTLDDASAEAVRSFAYVKAVHEDTEMRTFAEDTTRITRLGVDRVWSELKTRGEGITVAVLDTGVDYNHPALAGKVTKGFDWITHDEDPIDEHGHGTHVAGIIAGDTEDVRGVAPGAQILAHRVLDQYGRGSSSGIIAAIEASFDPNYDGDFSDRADIINLSLGGDGDADSPTSIAVDNAVRAGVVVMLAAGNTPGGQSIGSPAASRLGITVGNAGPDDRMHFTSSSGPSFPELTLKPEIAAPGESIRSAKLGGGTLVASGTSMAAPHAAGVAALLLALHPDWKPEDVKAALIASAKQNDADEVMRQGAGRIDAYAAALASSAISPAVVTFGRSASARAWSSTSTVRITNRSSEDRTFRVNAIVPKGVRVVADPVAFGLEAGGSRDVVLSASIDGEADASSMTMSLGGRIEFAAGDATVHVPWIAIQGALATVTNARPSTVVWGCDQTSAIARENVNGDYVALLPYRDCGVVVMGHAAAIRLLVQSHQVAHDLQLDGNLDRGAPFEVKLRGAGPEGTLLADRADETGSYQASYRFDFPRLAFRTIAMTTVDAAPIYLSALREDVTISTGEALLDVANRRLVSLQHPALHGLDSAETLTSPSGDLRHARVQVPAMPGMTLQGLAVPFVADYGAFAYVPGGSTVPLDQGWTGDVYVTRERDTPPTIATALFIGREVPGALRAMSRAFRAIDGRILTSSDVTPAPHAYGVDEGGTLTLFGRPRFAGTYVDALATSLFAYVSFYGSADEFDFASGAGLSYKLMDGSGRVLTEGVTDYVVGGDFGHRGAYRLEVTSSRAQIATTFDTSRTDYNPPTLSSMRFEGGTVRFSVADMQLGEDWIVREGGTLQSAKLSWRNGAGPWQEVPVTQLFVDRGTYEDIGHNPTGVHFEGDVPESGHIDLRYEMVDTSGNTSVVTLNDIHGAAMKGRAVRH